MNASININLMKLQGAFIQQFQSRDGQLFECVCLPIDHAMLYRTDNSVYLNAVIKPSKEEKYGYDHYVRQNVAKEKFGMLTEEQRKQIPYIGNAKIFAESGQKQAAYSASPTPTNSQLDF